MRQQWEAKYEMLVDIISQLQQKLDATEQRVEWLLMDVYRGKHDMNVNTVRVLMHLAAAENAALTHQLYELRLTKVILARLIRNTDLFH
ncbi:hypothetical protein [Paenibacillus puerhi]|uniref:hypothetical protein n=1 Tax=Paenibacillus puerhi TaxID=2692622 RepID=UPI0013589A03|nr:hypothetical protein [Paenibacillus puerhi]